MQPLTHGILRILLDGSTEDIPFVVGTPLQREDFAITWTQSPHAHGISLEMDIHFHLARTIEDLWLEGKQTYTPQQHILINAFQSWSSASEHTIQEVRLPLQSGEDTTGWIEILKNFGDYSFAHYDERPGHFHSYTYLMFREAQKETLLFGSTHEAEGYTIWRTSPSDGTLRVQKDWQGVTLEGSHKPFSLWFGKGQESDVFASYAASWTQKTPNYPPLSGWTSWYHYYTDISEEVILQNLQSFQELEIPADIFQIDDGYQLAIGEWLQTLPDRFPHGMKPIADNIHAAGYKAGLWLAPFICEEKSSLPKEHPDWFLRDDAGALRVVGNNPFYWSGEFYALDIYHPEVQAYLEKVFATVLEDWGFDMVKLDFLYGAALWPPAHKSRGMVMYDGMAMLRRWCKDRMILGCGVPLGSAWGHVDFCRIGSDVGLAWEDEFLSQIQYQERISTINSLNSTLARRHLNHRAFVNDPDVYFLRDQNISMTEDQKYSLYLGNQIFGSLLFTSDPIGEYEDIQRELYLAQFPVLPKEIESFVWEKHLRRATFSIQQARYTVVMNLQDQTEDVELKAGLYYEHRAGWIDLRKEQRLTLAPYQSRCLYHVPEDIETLAGGDVHLFPCSEIHLHKENQEATLLQRHPHTRRDGYIYLRIPEGNSTYLFQGKSYAAQQWSDLHYIAIPSADLTHGSKPNKHL
ncbi:MAG: alpha-galactosidase [Myxococcales bacterium]|nr:alpha-galactosidase [Myxococcales bacterium]